MCRGEVCKGLHPCHPEGADCFTSVNTLDTYECRDAAGNKRKQVCVAIDGNEGNLDGRAGVGKWRNRG